MEPNSFTKTSFCNVSIDNITTNNVKKYILDHLKLVFSGMEYNKRYAKIYNNNYSKNLNNPHIMCLKSSGTPYLLLNDLGEKVVFDIFFKVRPTISFKVVFPQLPVIAIIFASIFCLKIDEHFVKKLSEFFTFTCLSNECLLLNLFTIAKLDFFLNACRSGSSYK